jgi:acetyl esterase/lipase
MAEAALPADDDVTAESIMLGGVPAERVAARTARADRVVLYAHGGGFCQGSPVTHRKLAGDGNPYPTPDSVDQVQRIRLQGRDL